MIRCMVLVNIGKTIIAELIRILYNMDPSSIALVVFSSAIVIGSLTSIIIINYRICCKKPEPVVQDWVITENVAI